MGSCVSKKRRGWGVGCVSHVGYLFGPSHQLVVYHNDEIILRKSASQSVLCVNMFQLD